MVKITFNVCISNTGRAVISIVNHNKPLSITNSLDRRPENDVFTSGVIYITKP